MQDIIVTYVGGRVEEFEKVERIHVSDKYCYIETIDSVYPRTVVRINSITLGRVDRVHIEDLEKMNDVVVEGVSDMWFETCEMFRYTLLTLDHLGDDLQSLLLSHGYDLWL